MALAISRPHSSIDTYFNEKTPRATIHRAKMITQRQKQALMDNLQLEVTERARKLRAQYALQAQSLHTRIELRVNRIPTSLRNVTLGELLDKHSKPAIVESKAASEHPSPNLDVGLAPVRPNKAPKTTPPTVRTIHGTKRPSDHFDNDKENTLNIGQAVSNPKKRTKANQERRHPDPSTVLSPKSSNARNLPQPSSQGQSGSQKTNQPTRSNSPLKAGSPIKPVTTSTSERPRGTKTTVNTGSTRNRPAAKPSTVASEPKPYATGRMKRGLAVASDRAVSSASSNTSGTSAGTTIVKKVGRALGASTTTGVKKSVVSGTVRKDTAATTARKAVPTAASTAGRRTLRKRA